MLFADHLVVVRGGGDLGTGAVLRLHRAGFPVVVLELALPLAIRTTVAVAAAARDGKTRVEDLDARRVEDAKTALEQARAGVIPLLIEPSLPTFPAPVSVVIDARMAKRKLDTSLDQAPLVVALGPGFTAGIDCHAVVETMRGHHLGRVIWEGQAAPNSGVPGIVGGVGDKRVLRAPNAGPVAWRVGIGDRVEQGESIGQVGGTELRTPITGVVRGLLPAGRLVDSGLKIADIDPRAEASACFEVSDKALAVGGGAVEAVLTWLESGSG
jgi:xanthine dehydrogenase accessory factor